MTHKTVVLQALQNFMGDDLQRAEASFRDCPPEFMRLPYGDSGKSRQQILDDCREHQERVKAAIEWVQSL